MTDDEANNWLAQFIPALDNLLEHGQQFAAMRGRTLWHIVYLGVVKVH